MLPFLIPILSTLASNGLSTLVSAIQVKGQEFVEDKIGIKLPPTPSELTPELISQLKIKEMEHEEILTKYAIESKNLELEQNKLEIDNTKDARNMNLGIQTSSEASFLAKNAAYIMDFLIIVSAYFLIGLLFFRDVPLNNKEILFTTLGLLLGHCGTVIGFHRGSSAASRSKDETIQNLHSKSRGE